MTLNGFDSVVWLILAAGILTAVSTPYWPMLLGPKFPKHVILHTFAASAIYFGYRGKSPDYLRSPHPCHIPVH